MPCVLLGIAIGDDSVQKGVLTSTYGGKGPLNGNPLPGERRTGMPKDLNGVTPTGGEVNTLCVALEVSGSSWVVAVGGPGEPDKQWHFIRPA